MERSYTSDLIACLKALEQDANTPKRNRWQEIIKLRAEIERAIFNFIWKSKTPRILKTILYNKGVSRAIIPDFKLCYGIIIIKTARYCYKNRQFDYWN